MTGTRMLVDGVPHYACSMLTHQVRGRAVQTIEGLEAADGTLHPVQQAVVDEQGFQCAFCMPGFVMNMVAMVGENPNPTRDEAAHYLGVSTSTIRRRAEVAKKMGFEKLEYRTEGGHRRLDMKLLWNIWEQIKPNQA